jgi:nitric oxide reductase subunit C
MIKNGLVFLVVVLGVLLAGCSMGASAAPRGDPEKGSQLFHQTSIDNAPGCMTCHSTEPDKVIVGPSLAGVAARAGERIPGVSAAEYLHACIVSPNDFIVPGFPAGVVFPDFQEVLTEDEIDDLVAYLLTLK